MSDKTPDLNRPQVRGTWVQTERKSHEIWARLSLEKPRAAGLLHVLVANMDRQNALVASHSTLAELSDMSISTVKRAIKDLTDRQWIQTIRVGSERGGSLAYIVNRRVAWGDKRENAQYALFNARVLVSEKDNPDGLDGPELNQIPSLGPGEVQLPSGEGEDPPSQPSLEGMEPDLPAIWQDEDGTEWEVNPETGEQQRRIV